jgi:hypothetical protein
MRRRNDDCNLTGRARVFRADRLLPMEDKLVEALAADVNRRIASAKESLAEQMQAHGLDGKNGWRIVEELRSTVEGTEWVFRPVHLREPSPDLETCVAIDHSGRLL